MAPCVGWTRKPHFGHVLFLAASAAITGVASGPVMPLDNIRHQRQDPTVFCTEWGPPLLIDGSRATANKPTDIIIHSTNGEARTWVDYLYPFEWEREFNALPAGKFSRQWWWASYAASSLYLVFLFCGISAMKERKAWDLKKPLALWNLFLAVFSFLGMVRTVPHLLAMQWIHGFEYTLCRAGIAGYGAGAAGCWTFLFIFSKYFELIDTAFLVLRKRKVGFLHWYHHCSVLLYCWHAYVWEMPTGIYFVTMNYSVHALMYWYYFLAAVGRPQKWGVFVTVVQLLQMVIGIAVTLHHLYFLTWAPVSNCDAHIPNLAGALGMYASYFILFAQFFFARYFNGSAGARTPSAKKME